jgi:hypothetical protein
MLLHVSPSFSKSASVAGFNPIPKITFNSSKNLAKNAASCSPFSLKNLASKVSVSPPWCVSHATYAINTKAKNTPLVKNQAAAKIEAKHQRRLNLIFFYKNFNLQTYPLETIFVFHHPTKKHLNNLP